MPVYILLFDTGSSAVLEHSGVKGMKWGVWNAETRARRTGKTSKQKAEVKEQRKQERATAAKKALAVGAVATVRSGFNPVVGGIALASTYAGHRVSSEAVRAGQPLLKKAFKDPEKQKMASDVAKVTLGAATSLGLTMAGAGAVSAVLSGNGAAQHVQLPFAWAGGDKPHYLPDTTLHDSRDREYTPMTFYGHHSLPGNLLGTKPHEHVHTSTEHSSNITSQLQENVPESLRNSKLARR